MRRFLIAVAALVICIAAGSHGTATAHAAVHDGAAQPLPSVVVVIQRYGAALRYAPDSNAEVFWNAACGDVLYVTGASNGWFRVYSYDYPNDQPLWVGGARVADVSNPPPYSCRGQVTYQMGDIVVAAVSSGCLSMRYSPGLNAAYDYCEPAGYTFTITNGPVDQDGVDWFQVWSRGTGYGWVRADFIDFE
jgi:hypothetical protein